MEWDTMWEDPLTSYVKQFAGLIGDQREQKQSKLSLSYMVRRTFSLKSHR